MRTQAPQGSSLKELSSEGNHLSCKVPGASGLQGQLAEALRGPFQGRTTNRECKTHTNLTRVRFRSCRARRLLPRASNAIWRSRDEEIEQ
jgi:hypothetical protein